MTSGVGDGPEDPSGVADLSGRRGELGIEGGARVGHEQALVAAVVRRPQRRVHRALEAPAGEHEIGAPLGPQDVVERAAVEPVAGGRDDRSSHRMGSAAPGDRRRLRPGCTAAAGGTTPTTSPPSARRPTPARRAGVGPLAAAPAGRQRSSRQATSATATGGSRRGTATGTAGPGPGREGSWHGAQLFGSVPTTPFTKQVNWLICRRRRRLAGGDEQLPLLQ